MPPPQDAPYPRPKSTGTDAALAELSTPTSEELAFAAVHTQRETAKVGGLLFLKTFQRLGSFLTMAEIPPRIVRHIPRRVGLTTVPEGLAAYDIGQP